MSSSIQTRLSGLYQNLHRARQSRKREQRRLKIWQQTAASDAMSRARLEAVTAVLEHFAAPGMVNIAREAADAVVECVKDDAATFTVDENLPRAVTDALAKIVIDGQTRQSRASAHGPLSDNSEDESADANHCHRLAVPLAIVLDHTTLATTEALVWAKLIGVRERAKRVSAEAVECISHAGEFDRASDQILGSDHGLSTAAEADVRKAVDSEVSSIAAAFYLAPRRDKTARSIPHSDQYGPMWVSRTEARRFQWKAKNTLHGNLHAV
jgi:hypothetical protein